MLWLSRVRSILQYNLRSGRGSLGIIGFSVSYIYSQLQILSESRYSTLFYLPIHSLRGRNCCVSINFIGEQERANLVVRWSGFFYIFVVYLYVVDATMDHQSTEDDLRRRRERERERRARETPEQRDTRVSQRQRYKERARERLATETEEEREHEGKHD